jgi:serine O-acetyltransferase
VVVSTVPPNSTVVGIPGRVVEGVERERTNIIDLEHHRLPDPIAKAISSLADYVQKLEKRVNELNDRQGGLEERQAEEKKALQRIISMLRNSGNAG